MLKEFARWPQYKINYIKAFDRMQKNNEAKGIFNKIGIRNGEEWFEWWIGNNPNQLKIDDIIERTE